MTENKYDKVITEARRQMDEREKGYREQALKMYPWICGRCSREFNRQNLRELTVHHRNHDHDYNPPDGSNWELLCIYCHDNEHSRYTDHQSGGGSTENDQGNQATFQPFADLKALLNKDD